MESSTPLLTPSSGHPSPNTMQDHPAFLRASHSPWRFIPQNVLVLVRGFLLAYLAAAGATAANYKLTEKSDFTQWRHVFDFSVISMEMTFIYHLMTFSWTFTHLYYPHPEDIEGKVESWIIGAMSLPRNMASLRKQFYFTMFYTATCVFAFMNSTVYWFITRQRLGGGDKKQPSLDDITSPLIPGISGGHGHDKPFSDLFGDGWFTAFNLMNLHGVNSLIMVAEILLLNSIKRGYNIGSHIFGLVVSSGLYLGWAGIGKAATGWYAFDWLNKDKVGSSEAVAAYCIGFVMLAPTMYILMQGFVGIRENLTKSTSESRREAASPEALES